MSDTVAVRPAPSRSLADRLGEIGRYDRSPQYMVLQRAIRDAIANGQVAPATPFRRNATWPRT